MKFDYKFIKNALLFKPTVGAIFSGASPATPKKMDFMRSNNVFVLFYFISLLVALRNGKPLVIYGGRKKIYRFSSII